MGTRRIGLVLACGLLAAAGCGEDESGGSASYVSLNGGTGTLNGGAVAETGGTATVGTTSGVTDGTGSATTAGATAGAGATGGGLFDGSGGSTSGASSGDPDGGATGADPAGDAGGGRKGGTGCLLAGGGDYNEDGPYTTASEDVTLGSKGGYTIFYPSPMDGGCLHPVVAWGNGTGVTGSGTYAFYQEHAASWGIVVIASHNSNVGSGAFHRAGLDYMYEQNEDPSSKFYGKLSEKAGTSGHSQGGIGATAGASHSNVVAIGNVQGAFGAGAPGGKALLCLTGTEDIAIDGCKSAVEGTNSPALFANWQGGTHTGTATVGGWFGGDPGTRQYRRLYTAWFRCFLDDDSSACALFMGGESCPVCQESGWAEIYANNY